MIRAGGIARGRADTSVLLRHQGLVGKGRVPGGVPPELRPNPLVQALGEGFRQAVGQGLGQDGPVVVVAVLEAGHQGVQAVAGGDHEGSHPVRNPGAQGRYEVREAEVGAAGPAPGFLAELLPEKGDHGKLLPSVVAGVEDQVVPPGGGGEEPEGPPGREKPLLHDLVQESPGVGQQLPGLVSHQGIVQDPGPAPPDLPRLEEGAPVDGLRQLAQVVALQAPDAGEGGLGGGIPLPSDRERPGSGSSEGEEVALLPLPAVPLPNGPVLIPGLPREGLPPVPVQEGPHHRDGPGGVQDVKGGAPAVGRLDLHGGVGLGGGGSPDEEGKREPQALHLPGHVDHLVQGGGDEAAEAHHVGLYLPGLLQDGLGGDHDPQIHHVIAVALEHHPHDVLADVVNVPLHGGQEDGAGVADCAGPGVGPGVGSGVPRGSGFRALRRAHHPLLLLHERHQVGHGLLHDPGALHHLGEEHPPRAEEITYGVHPVHEGTFDDVQGPGRHLAGLFHVHLHELVEPLHQGVAEALVDRGVTPGQVSLLLDFHPLVAFGQGRKALRGVGAPGEEDVLHRLQELRLHLVVDRQGAGIHDPHVQAGGDGVLEECGMHGLPHLGAPPEGEGEVADAAAHQGVGAGLLQHTDGVHEVHGVAVVLGDPRGHGEHVGIEDDVLRGKAFLLHQDPVGAAEDLHLPLHGVGLAHLIEGHDDEGVAVAPHGAGLLPKQLLPLLQGDGVHHALSLETAHSGLQDLPAGGVHHHRDAGDVGLGAHQVQEPLHGPHRVQEPLVHVYVQHLGAPLHLLAGHLQPRLVLPGLDEAAKAGRARDVGPLPHVGEEGVGAQGEGLQARQAGPDREGRGPPGREAGHCLRQGPDVVRRGAAAPPHHVQEARLRQLPQFRRHGLRTQVVASHLVGESCVGMDCDPAVRQASQFLHVGPELLRAQGAVQAHGEEAGGGGGVHQPGRAAPGKRAGHAVAHRVPEGLHRLAR